MQDYYFKIVLQNTINAELNEIEQKMKMQHPPFQRLNCKVLTPRNYNRQINLWKNDFYNVHSVRTGFIISLIEALTVHKRSTVA